MEKEKDLVVVAEDRYGEGCFKDSTSIVNSKRNPTGFVNIFELTEHGDKHLIGKSNLVVYLGREWLASRAFNSNNENIYPATKNEFICWFGLGSGGVVVESPLVAIPPTNSDTALTTEIPISTTDATCGDLRNGSYYKHQLYSITYQQDAENNNAWLITKVVIAIGADDANNYNLSEAGLYVAESNASGYSGSFSLFAKITFPTIVKTNSRQLTFEWYIYF